MTREAFIRKWLSNPEKQYDEHCRNEMRDDLDMVIKHAYIEQGDKLRCNHLPIRYDVKYTHCKKCNMVLQMKP